MQRRWGRAWRSRRDTLAILVQGVHGWGHHIFMVGLRYLTGKLVRRRASQTARSRDGVACTSSLYSCLDQKTNFCVASNFPGAVVYGTYDSHNIISQLGECSQNDALALNMNKILLSETDSHADSVRDVRRMFPFSNVLLDKLQLCLSG